MARKYDRIDEQLLGLLRDHTGEITTASAIEALQIDCSTTQRHISRRFSLLEDRGALVCSLKGTTRVCTVQLERLPTHMHKGDQGSRSWRSKIRSEIDGEPLHDSAPPAPMPTIEASNSEEFLARGGVIERLPTHWDQPRGRSPIGVCTFLDLVSDLD